MKHNLRKTPKDTPLLMSNQYDSMKDQSSHEGEYTWMFQYLPPPTTAFKITTQRLHINYILSGLFVQAYY